VARDRIASGLAGLVPGVAVSLGIATIVWSLWRSSTPLSVLLLHFCALSCLVLLLSGRLVSRSRPAVVPRGVTVVAVLETGAVVTGLLAVIVIVYAAVTEGLFRTLLWRYEATPYLQIWRTGFVDLALIATALVLVWQKSKNPELLTAILWLLVLAAAWLAFQTPAFRTDSEGRSLATPWAGVLMLLLAVVAGAFVIGTGWAHRRRRQRAWPDALYLLAEPPIDWPGLRYSIGILAAVILLLGCSQLLLPWTGPAAILAGSAALTLTHRQWDENLADVGIALITLGVVAMVVMCFPDLPVWWTADAWAEVVNRILLGLAIMAGLWYWLGAFWRQQLDDGQAWTTTGRLIHTVRRVGYFVAAAGVLVSYHLAFWPVFPYGNDDADIWRWGWGLTANGLLILVLLLASRKTQKSTLGWLVVFAVAGTIMFSVVRMPHGLPGHLWALYWPTVMAVAAGILVILGALLARTQNWQALFEPMYLTGVTILPVGAIGGILFGAPQTMPPWVPAVSFACLVAVYILAAVLVGPKTFIAVAVLCAAMSFWRMQDATGWARIAPLYYQAMLVSLSIGLWAWVTYQRQPRRVLWLIRWAGIVLSVASIVAGLIASRR
jgi:hypothetical protein